jgi:hypothetical protein
MRYLVLTELSDELFPDHTLEGPFDSLEDAEQTARRPLQRNEIERLLCAILEKTGQ